MRAARALVPAALLLALSAVTGLAAGVAAPAMAASDAAAPPTSSIDHAQPLDGKVRLLVSLPDGEVDLSGVTVRVAGTKVPATAAPASTSNDVRRTSILAIDTSDSMRGERIAAAKRAALTYLSTVPANVRIGVLTFDDTVKTLVKPTIDRGRARSAIDGLTLTRNTALYDGVLGALKAAGPAGASAGQRRVLLLTDGDDTTTTSLIDVVDQVKASGVTLDAIAFQKKNAQANPDLGILAQAGKGSLVNALDARALSAAFADEADALARQIVVTATIPAGSPRNADVDVTTPLSSGAVSTSAYLALRPAAKKAAAPSDAGPTDVASSPLTVSGTVVLAGVGAIGVGLLGLILVLAFSGPKVSKEDQLAEQMKAYGVYSTNDGAASRQDRSGSIADQARDAASKALANNAGLEARIAVRLEGAGMDLKPAEWLLLHSGVVVAAGLLGLGLGRGSIVMALVFMAAGAVGAWLFLGIKRKRRLKAFGSALADTLQLMSGSLSAGLSLAQSIDTIVKEGSEPITSEFKRVIVESRLGVPLEDSMEGVAQRMESRDFGWVVMAIKIQREVGGNLAELLLTVAATLREREYLRRHVKALSAEGRLSAYILGGLPPVFLLYLTLTKPDYTAPMYSTPVGWILCAGMAVLLGVGVLWMSKVATVDV